MREILNIKAVMKRLLDEHIPEIVKLEQRRKKIEAQATKLRSLLEQLTLAKQELDEEIAPRKEAIMNQMTEFKITKLTTDMFGIVRCRDANPTVEIIELEKVPTRYIVEKPQANKRLIQAEFVNNQTVPPGAKVGYGQYLKIIERKVKACWKH